MGGLFVFKCLNFFKRCIFFIKYLTEKLKEKAECSDRVFAGNNNNKTPVCVNSHTTLTWSMKWA